VPRGLDRGELEFLVGGGEHAGRAVARMRGGAPAHGLVDHVDDVALLDEIFGPALAAVRRSHPVGRGLRGAVNEHQRIGPAHILGGQHLDIDLPLHDLLAGLADIFSADIEIAALRDRRLVDRGHGQPGWLGAGRREPRACRKNRDPDGVSKAATHGFLPWPRRRGRYCFIVAPDRRVRFHCKQQWIYKAAPVLDGLGGVTKSTPPSLPPDQKAARGRLACLH